MIKNRSGVIIFVLSFFLYFIIGMVFALHWPTTFVLAQSTGDTLHLPTRTPFPQPASTPTNSLTSPPEQVWVARLVSNTLAVTEGQGSIFRVNVDGLLDTPIKLSLDEHVITANSGSKPEYGRYAAEFAPVTKGVWTVSVPSLGVSLQVEADNYNLAVIEVVQVAKSAATEAPLATVTPTPFGAKIWQGRIISETPGDGVPFSRVLVQVVGLNDHSVQLSTVSQVINTATTGQKPNELGPNMVEFAGLTPGHYFIDPTGLNATLPVELKPDTVTHVEFRSLAVASSTALPTIAVVPSGTPSPRSPTLTATPTPSSTPVPSPLPVTRWIGVVQSRVVVSQETGTIKVRVPGTEGLSIKLNRTDNKQPVEKLCITGQDGQGQDVCQFQQLRPGWHLISLEHGNVSLPVLLSGYEIAHVVFDVEMLPAGITGWQAQTQKNTNGVSAVSKTEGLLQVKVAGRKGQVVALQSIRLGTTQYCEVAYNPDLGGLGCEFEQLGPGVYHVEALHTGAASRLFVDGVGVAKVEFLPNATYATQVLTPSSSVVGQGALPFFSPPTATPTILQPVSVINVMTPTVIPSGTPTVTPTPAFAWQGRIVESAITGAGALGVRAAGLKDHPVILRSGGWQSEPQLTGTKEELGEYSTEFGGLAAGEYIVELVDLAEVTVNLGGGQFMLVEFRYDFAISQQNDER